MVASSEAERTRLNRTVSIWSTWKDLYNLPVYRMEYDSSDWSSVSTQLISAMTLGSLTVESKLGGVYLSGGRGIQSVASLVLRVAPPSTTSFCISDSFCSKSITLRCRRITDVHFFSRSPLYLALLAPLSFYKIITH